MKNLLLIILVMFFYSVYCTGQTVRLFEIQDTVWYSMDKKAAQNIIYKANKALYFDQYVAYRDKLLDQVLIAKIKSDSIQIVLQQDLATCKSYLISSEQDKVRLNNKRNKLSDVNKKLTNQRNLMMGITAVAVIVLASSL